ncbi:hypothetical protein [Spirillospora sp. NPDC047279]|uniref:hypothetical protein n=1 Tax=Spirillospora sp. NPDC047279 TaxID=3155478 RepID=UPI0033D56BBB
MKFEASMCLACNGKRSQKFDDAYVRYSRYVWQNMDSLWRRDHINMAEVFGASWPVDTVHLARYFAKHAACSFVDSGFKTPQSIIDFLDEATDRLSDMHMVLYKDQGLRRYRRTLKRVGVEGGGIHIEPAAGILSRSRKCLTSYSSAYALGFIGVKYYWKDGSSPSDSFYLHQKAPIHRRDRIPEI